jgi:hypothetical protein
MRIIPRLVISKYDLYTPPAFSLFNLRGSIETHPSVSMRETRI